MFTKCFRHSCFIVWFIVEYLSKTEDSVNNPEIIITAEAKQLICHNAFLDEIIVQVAIEPVGAILLREAVQIESTL